jgi:hypothetical protein
VPPSAAYLIHGPMNAKPPIVTIQQAMSSRMKVAVN